VEGYLCSPLASDNGRGISIRMESSVCVLIDPLHPNDASVSSGYRHVTESICGQRAANIHYFLNLSCAGTAPQVWSHRINLKRAFYTGLKKTVAQQYYYNFEIS
jgi:hypothetical protein